MTGAELKKHLDQAEKSPKLIAAAVSGLAANVLRHKPSPEKWSILEILAHLADMEILYAYRLRQMLADRRPIIAPINQDDWAKHLGYMQETAPELIALYGLNRHHNLQLLRRVSAADLEKSAFHPELQRNISVAELVETLSKHGTNHLEQIERLKNEPGASRPSPPARRPAGREGTSPSKKD